MKLNNHPVMLQSSIVCLQITLLFVLLLSAPMLAKAEFSSSPTKNVSVYGRSYSFYSSVSSDSSGAWSHAHVNADGNLPAGYCGAKGRLFDSQGTLRAQSAWRYNAGGTSGLGEMTPTYRQPGTYYGQAQAQFYNGNGYQTYTAYRTPNIHSRLSNSPILLNDKGEKCGSALHHPDGLDLILAMGELGRVGYVRNRDLNPIPPNTPDEALSHSASTYDNVAIPIYDFQGEAVVDLFIVTQSIPCNCPACNLKQPSSHSNR